MKAKDATKAAFLIKQYKAISDVKDDLKRRTPERGYSRRVLVLGIWDQSEDGGTGGAEAELPLDLAPLLIDRLEEIVGDELAKLGVELPA